VRRAYLAVGQKLAQARGHVLLAAVRARGVDALVEGGGRALECFERHGAGHVGRAREFVCAFERERADGRQRLRPVQERQPLFDLQTQRLKPRATQRLRARQSLATKKSLALADAREREVRERREVSARPDRALLRDDRVDAALKHPEERLRDRHARTAQADGEHVGAQEHQRTRLFF
jgi:hypothetical protein